MGRYTVLFFTWLLCSLTAQNSSAAAEDGHEDEIVSTILDGISVTPEGCLNNPNTIHVQNLCEVLPSLIKTKDFSLDLKRNNANCKVRLKWLDVVLLNPSLLKCLGLKLKWKPDQSQNGKSPLQATIPPETTIALSITKSNDEKQTIEKTCKKELKLGDLELVLSETVDNSEKNNETTSEQEEEENVSKYAYCQWSVVDKNSNEVNIDSLKADGFTIEFEENTDGIDCAQNGSKKYDCTHELDDSRHIVTLAISDKTGRKITSTCEIPSLEELLQEQKSYRPQLQAKPVTPPKLIRYNFGSPMLSPGVF